MIKIGLTGNIASGKSTVEAIIAEFGYKVVDLDKVSHSLLETTCRNEILKAFKTTERKKIADIVFKDKNELKKLENIIHPKLKEYILNYFEENKSEKAVFISGALIYEAGFSDLFNKIIFVDCDKNIRLKRLIQRNSYDEETAKRRIEAQSDDFKSKADFIIRNNNDIKELKNNTIELLNIIFS